MFGDTLRQVQDFKNQYDEHGLANAIHWQSLYYPTW
jgi:hypothetical protein